MTTAVQDRLDLDLTELKALLGITGAEQDAYLTLLLAAAKREADNYLNNPFVDAFGAELPIPDNVKWGVVVWVGLRLAAGGGLIGGGGGVPRDPSIRREKVGQIEREYFSGGETTGEGTMFIPSSDVGLRAVYWDSEKFEAL